MTQTFSATQTATFAESIRISNADTARLCVGAKVTTAEAVNNLEYRKADGTTVAKCGLKVEFDNGIIVGFFRWDLIPSIVELTEDGKFKPLVIKTSDILRQTAKSAATTASNEEQWLKAIADAVVGKVGGTQEFLYQSAKGAKGSSVLLTIE